MLYELCGGKGCGTCGLCDVCTHVHFYAVYLYMCMDLCLHICGAMCVCVYGEFVYICAMCVLYVHIVCHVCKYIPMCGVHIFSMCICVYTCEKQGITFSSNCKSLSRTCHMASSSVVNLEPTWGGGRRTRALWTPSGSPFLITWLRPAQLLCPLNAFVVALTHVRPG